MSYLQCILYVILTAAAVFVIAGAVAIVHYVIGLFKNEDEDD